MDNIYDFPLLNISPWFNDKLDFGKSSDSFNLELSLSSTSNIWYDELKYSDINGMPILFENPYNNRPVAYRITPRFNSFIREIKKEVQRLEGTLTIEENYNCDNNGYFLLDSKTIFQEDIETGIVIEPN